MILDANLCPYMVYKSCTVWSGEYWCSFPLLMSGLWSFYQYNSQWNGLFSSVWLVKFDKSEHKMNRQIARVSNIPWVCVLRTTFLVWVCISRKEKNNSHGRFSWYGSNYKTVQCLHKNQRYLLITKHTNILKAMLLHHSVECDQTAGGGGIWH